jgi:hypothetical protein
VHKLNSQCVGRIETKLEASFVYDQDLGQRNLERYVAQIVQDDLRRLEERLEIEQQQGPFLNFDEPFASEQKVRFLLPHLVSGQEVVGRRHAQNRAMPGFIRLELPVLTSGENFS